MDVSINALIEQVDALLYARAAATFRYVAGLDKALPLGQVLADFPALSRLESFQAVREVVQNPRTDAERRRGLQMLLGFLAECFEQAQAAGPLEEVAATESTATVSAGSLSLPLHQALSRISEEPSRERRGLLESAAADVLWAQQAPWAHRVDAGIRAAAQLGFGSYAAMQEDLTGVGLAALAEDAKGLLASTKDAWRDLLTYALKRVDPDLKAPQARLHDVQRAAAAPWMFELFRKSEVMPACTRCLGDLGLDPNQGGRISFDTEVREGKRAGARVLALRIPDDVRLVLTPAGGLGAFADALRALGRAQHHALAARTTHVLDRRLGDGAVAGAVATLFEHVLLDAGWYRRYLRLPTAQAKEAARLFAFRQLFRLRWRAALVGYGLDLYLRGPVRPLADAYEDTLTGALGVGVPRGRFLYDIEPGWKAVGLLRAMALEANLHGVLRERYNEDFWRNPATGRWLATLSASGQRDGADQVARDLGAPGLSLTAAGRRLVAVMGA